MNPKQQAFLARAIEELDKREFFPMSTQDMAEALFVPPQAAKAILDLGAAHGHVYRVDSDLFYSPGQVRFITDSLSASNREGFDAPSFRNETGLSRRLADLLLRLLEEKAGLVKEGPHWSFTNGVRESEIA